MIRDHFPILQSKTYLYSCSQGALSDEVETGMREYAESWRSSTDPWAEWMQKYEEIRCAFARFIHAKPEEIAILTSASAGINPIANSLDFAERKRVVMGEFEFPTMGHIWLAQQARGAEVEFLSGTGDSIPLERYEQAIDRSTMIVPLTQVSFVNGFRSDEAAVSRMAHEQGALVFLDGFQDCGTRPIDVKKLDVDFYVTGTLKYMLGPSGLAFLYVREELIEKLVPPMTSWFAQRDIFSFNTQVLDRAPSARRFEGGTPPVPNIYAALPAIALLDRIGLDKIATHIESLARDFLYGAQSLKIESKTPADTVGPLIVLRSKNAPALVAEFAKRNIVTSCRKDGVRFSFHLYNNLADVNAALTALEDNLDLMVRQ